MPRIITARSIGLAFQDVFGELGPERHVTGHHTAGAKDSSDKHCEQVLRAYHHDHMRKGWGGIGYHFCVSRKGTIYCLRPTTLKGAHVGGHNTGNIGVVFHGTTGDRPTGPQARAFHWLLRNAHTTRLPAAHRTDRKIFRPHADRRGHKQWSGHEWNACPGTHLTVILSGGKDR